MRRAALLTLAAWGIFACDSGGRGPVAAPAATDASASAVSTAKSPLASASAPASRAQPDAAAKPASCGLPKLVEGRTTKPIASAPKPKQGVFFDEPSFHTCVARATSHDADGIDTFARNDYSRRQAFNADSSQFIASSRDGGWYLYDTKTLRMKMPLAGLSGDAEPQWHPTDPLVLYYGDRNGGLEIRARDLRTGATKPFIDLRGKLPWPGAMRAWTKSEGSPSRDGRYWGFQVETEKFDILGFAVWDAVLGKLVGTMPSKTRPDHVSMSPSGRWLVVSGEGGTVAWSPDFKQKRQLHKRTEHSDLAVGVNGHDYYVSIDYEVDGNVFMVDIDTGQRTDLLRTYVNGAATAAHISGKAYDKPGWVLVSTYNAGGPPQWYMDKVFVMELAAKPRIYELAAHHSVVKEEYFAEPHASVNRTFTLALFNSNWGTAGSADVDAYIVRMPEGSFP